MQDLLDALDDITLDEVEGRMKAGTECPKLLEDYESLREDLKNSERIIESSGIDFPKMVRRLELIISLVTHYKTWLLENGETTYTPHLSDFES